MNTTTNTTYVRLHNTTDQTTCKLKLTVSELFDLLNWKSWSQNLKLEVRLYLKQVTAQQNNENQIKMLEKEKSLLTLLNLSDSKLWAEAMLMFRGITP